MNTFERAYHVESKRELNYKIENNSIELSDQEYLERLVPSARFIKFNKPSNFDDILFKVSIETKLIENQTQTPMNIMQEEIRKDKKDMKNNKIVKPKPKKIKKVYDSIKSTNSNNDT